MKNKHNLENRGGKTALVKAVYKVREPVFIKDIDLGGNGQSYDLGTAIGMAYYNMKENLRQNLNEDGSDFDVDALVDWLSRTEIKSGFLDKTKRFVINDALLHEELGGGGIEQVKVWMTGKMYKL